MSFSRKMLKAMGIEDDKIDQIIEAHSETVDGLKNELATAKQAVTDAESIAKERDALQAKIADLEKSGGDAAAARNELEEYKAQIAGEKIDGTKRSYLEGELRKAGARESAIKLLMQTADLGKIEMDGDAVKGDGGIIEAMRTNYSDMFGKMAQQGAPATNPLGGGKSFTLEQVQQMSPEEINKNWSAVSEVLKQQR